MKCNICEQLGLDIHCEDSASWRIVYNKENTKISKLSIEECQKAFKDIITILINNE
jgi:hypothetical protein